MDKSIKIELKSEKIPYEIRRNIPSIYKFRNIYYYENKFHYYSEGKKRKIIPSSLLKDFKVDKKITYPLDKCLIIDKAYIFWPMSLNNIGHFMYDNVIPIYKMMVIDQDEFDIDTNHRILLIRRPEEKKKEQTLTEKGKEILKIFSNNAHFINDIKKPIFFKNVIMQNSNLRTRPWNEYSTILKNDNINKFFFKNFVQIIKKKYKTKATGVPGPNNCKIVLLSRGLAKWRRTLNEDKLVKKLKESKYDIELVKFENLSLKEEIDLMNQTKILIAPYGAGVMAASLFLQPDSTCIIVNPIGFSFKFDFPKMLLKFLERLNIKTIAWINDIGRQGSHPCASRDSDMKININQIIIFLKDIKNKEKILKDKQNKEKKEKKTKVRNLPMIFIKKQSQGPGFPAGTVNKTGGSLIRTRNKIKNKTVGRGHGVVTLPDSQQPILETPRPLIKVGTIRTRNKIKNLLQKKGNLFCN